MSNLTRIRREHPEMAGKPICSKCGGEADRAPQRYCRACNNAYQREWKRERAEVARSVLGGRRRLSRETKV